MNETTKTRPARRAAPSIARASAKVFSTLAQQTKYADPALADNWPDIAGPDIARLCRPGKLTGRGPGRTLEVRVPSGAAAAQIQMMTDPLLTRLNAYLGPGGVARITITQASRAHEPANPGANESDSNPDDAEKSPLGAALSSFRQAINRRHNKK